MTFVKDINPIGWIILFMCVGIMYCLLLIILKPFNNNWGIAWLGVIFGTLDLIYLSGLFISDIISNQKELNEIEARKTWIEKVCEKGI